MGVLDLSEIDYKECAINQLKEYIRKFYGNYGPITFGQLYCEIEGYLVSDIESLTFVINCTEDDLMDSGIYICRGTGESWDKLYIIVSRERPYFRASSWTEKNGSGLDVDFEKVVNFLSHCDDSKYSKFYNFRYNKYYGDIGCECRF